MSERAAKNYETMLSLGHACGLQTVSESYSQMLNHWDAFFFHETVSEEVAELEQYIVGLGTFEKTILEVKGQAWVDEENRLEKEYFDSQEEVDEEDFLAGVACNADTPEECESCQ